MALGAALLGSSAGSAAAPALELPGLNAREERANNIWMLRAGLNVAALQCQFSPFLATVPTYNALLRHHSDEMADAFRTMSGYFVRSNGPRTGPRAFDTYATRTNQSWSTFDAQLTFCDRASLIGRRALEVPKGRLGDFATAELQALRASLERPAPPRILQTRLEWVEVPTFSDPCPRRPVQRCR